MKYSLVLFLSILLVGTASLTFAKRGGVKKARATARRSPKSSAAKRRAAAQKAARVRTNRQEWKAHCRAEQNKYNLSAAHAAQVAFDAARDVTSGFIFVSSAGRQTS